MSKIPPCGFMYNVTYPVLQQVRSSNNGIAPHAPSPVFGAKCYNTIIQENSDAMRPIYPYMTRAEEAKSVLVEAVEERVASLVHIHDVKKYEKSENGDITLEITFSDNSILQIQVDSL